MEEEEDLWGNQLTQFHLEKWPVNGSSNSNSSLWRCEVSHCLQLLLLLLLPFCDPLSGITRMSRYQKLILDFAEADMMGAVASAEPHASYLHFAPGGNHTSTSSVRFFTFWMPFLAPNQQRQSTDCLLVVLIYFAIITSQKGALFLQNASRTLISIL